MLALSPPTPRDVESLRNWLEGNKCIAEEECTYIKHNRDLVSLVPDGDRASVKLEALVEQLLIKLWRGFRKVKSISAAVTATYTHHLPLRDVTTISRTT
jgi:hypothetical protein